MDDYIYPIKLTYNRQFLFDTCKELIHWPKYTNDRGKTFFSTHRDILFPINIEAIRIKNTLLESTTFSFSYVPPGHETGWHTDYTRGCTLIVPIDENPHLIRFEIGNTIVDYCYTTPVLTNAKTNHNGVNLTEHDRFNLLFHFDKSYDHIKMLADENKLVTLWKQDYNIFSDLEVSLIDQFFDTHNDLELADIVLTSNKDLAIKAQDKFVIFVGNSVCGNTTILISDKTNDKDIVNSIKFILDSPGCITSIDLR